MKVHEIMWLVCIDEVPSAFFNTHEDAFLASKPWKEKAPLTSVTIHKTIMCEIADGRKRHVIMTYVDPEY